MSDSFQSYVFGRAPVDDYRADFRRVTAWLLAEEIIGSETADNVLGDDFGFVPGLRASSIMVKDYDGWRRLGINGVAIRTGRVIEASGNWEFSRCPHCGVRIDIDPMSEDSVPICEALEAFHEGRDSGLECAKCGVRSKLEYWDFGDAMAVGDAVVTFWNWPEQIDDLPRQLALVSGMTCRKVWGRI
jgi:DNA-directed RNA polymerase subunit RPC12/RpoP